MTSGPMAAADHWLANLLYALRTPLFVEVFSWVTWLGDWRAVFALALLFSLLVWMGGERAQLLPLWTVLLGTEIFVLLGKWAFPRARPQGVPALVENSSSFPSGHAATSVAFYGFMIYLLWRNVPGRKKRIGLLCVGMAVIIAVGFSRLYLGLHYLSDVLGGYLLGLLWLLVGIALAEWMRSGKDRRRALREGF